MSTSPLSGIKVVDLTQAMAGPCCSMLLADFGAEVIKIEPPQGDMLRQWGPPFIDDIGAYFLMFNRNKLSLALNLRRPEGLEIFYRLARRADVVVESFRPRVKDKLKIDYQTLAPKNPGLIYTSISGFGQSGPYADRPGFDPIAQGMSGLMSITGDKETGPTRAGVAIGDYLAGVFAALGTMAALHERERSGLGQEVNTSLLEVLVGALGFQAAKHLATGERPLPQGNDHAMQSPYGCFKTKDGHINIAAGNQAMWERLAQALGLEELIPDERFLAVADRVKNRPALTAAIEEKLASKASAAWQDIFNQAGVASGPILHVDEVFADPQVLHQEMLKTIEHPSLGLLKTIGFSANLSRTPAEIKTPPPLLGQHTEEILIDLGYEAKTIAQFKKDGVV